MDRSDESVVLRIDRDGEESTMESEQLESARKVEDRGGEVGGGGAEETPEEYSQSRKSFVMALGVVTLAGLVGVILVWLSRASSSKRPPWGSRTFFDMAQGVNIHVTLMVTFFVFVQGYAVLMFRILPGQRKATVKMFHAGLHGLVVAGMLLAFVQILQFRNVKFAGFPSDTPVHFTSLHGWLGVIGIGLYLSHFLGGLLLFFLPFHLQVRILPTHTVLGSVYFALISFIGLSGMTHMDTAASAKTPWSGTHLQLKLAAVFILVFSIGVIILLTQHSLRRRPRPFLQSNL